MNDTQHWLEREILDAFYKIATDFRSGVIDENTLKDRVLEAARRYERTILADEGRELGLLHLRRH